MLLAFAYTWLPIGKSICGSNTFAKHGRFAELCRNCMQSQHNLLLKMNVVRVIYTVATMVQGRLSGSSAILQAPLTPIRFWSMNQPGAVSLSQLLMVHFRPCSQTRLSVTVCQVRTSYALLLITWYKACCCKCYTGLKLQFRNALYAVATLGLCTTCNVLLYA